MDYRLAFLTEKLNSIAQKFDNDKYSLFAAINFLAYPKISVTEFCDFLEDNGGRSGWKSKFYNQQLQCLQSLNEEEKIALNFLGKYHSEHPLQKNLSIDEWLPTDTESLSVSDELF